MFGLVYPDCGMWMGPSVKQTSGNDKRQEWCECRTNRVGEREGASVDGGVVLTPLTSVLGQRPDRCRLSAFPT